MSKRPKVLEPGNPKDKSRAGSNIRWIEKHCYFPEVPVIPVSFSFSEAGYANSDGSKVSTSSSSTGTRKAAQTLLMTI